MGVTVAWWALCGAGAGFGAWLLLTAIHPNPRPPAHRARPPAVFRHARWTLTVRAGLAVTAGTAATVVTGWPVAAVLAAVAAWTLPTVLGPDRHHARRVARIDAIATWTEMLRDTLSGAAGLHQAITATAPAAPAAIRRPVNDLTSRLQAGQRLPTALRDLARDLDDPTGDLVVAALTLAAQRQAAQLTPLLGAVAATARDQAGMRLRVAASRARIRTSVRVITGVTVAMAAGLIVFNRGYLTPYDGAAGQLVLATIGGVFTASLAWLTRIGRIREPHRTLAPPTRAGAFR